jgi:glutathione synthase/RimK-type ligase-like ATP-grasp enzyme
MTDAFYKYDAVILTDRRYLNPDEGDWYIENIITEDDMVKKALEGRGFKVGRVSWDDPVFDWSSAQYVIFRSTWDYWDRFPEFLTWLDRVHTKTSMINPYKTIRWNLDKHYLGDLLKKGVRIPPTLFIDPGDRRSLAEIIKPTGWTGVIMKPAVSGGARHTYRMYPDTISNYEPVFRELIAGECMLVQEFQENVILEGEMAFMVFGGKYSHAVQKIAREGDFRVQDDFGGTVLDYEPSGEEIDFAERVVSVCNPLPVYARVDVIHDNHGRLCVSELELIEPELWFRNNPQSAGLFADAFADYTMNSRAVRPKSNDLW